jgi:hypothetical protein
VPNNLQPPDAGERERGCEQRVDIADFSPLLPIANRTFTMTTPLPSDIFVWPPPAASAE